MNDDAPSYEVSSAWWQDETDSAEHSGPRIGLAFAHDRNRELVADILAEYETVTVTGQVPADIDVCLVDERGFRELQERFAAWKRAEQPSVAPVLLLSQQAEDAWKRYSGSFGSHIDAIVSIPASRHEILARVEGLLETRRYSVMARERQSQLELYERAMNGANIGITIADATDPRFPLVYVNRGFLDITGYGYEDVLGRNCSFLQGTKTDPQTVARIRHALDDRQPVSVEIYNYRASGKPFWNQLDIMPVSGDDGTVTHFLGFQQDITERKRREALLEQNAQVFDAVHDPVIVLDEQGSVVDFNEATENLCAANPGELHGRPLVDLLPTEAANSVSEAIDSLESVGDERKVELTVWDPDGRETVLQFYFQLEQLSGDPPERRIIAIGRDITSIRRRESQLTVLDRILRHNLRNKLNVVLGNTQLLTDGTELDPEDVERSTESIITAANELLSIGNTARRFSTTRNRGDTVTDVVDINAVVTATLSDIEQAHSNAEIRTDIPPGLRVRAPENLGLCIEEIVENSIEHTDSGCVSIVITAESAVHGEGIELRITDNGPGFPEMERAVLTSGTETQLEHTQGVGLWLVKWAVESVGGGLRIENHEAGGATVALVLPTPDE